METRQLLPQTSDFTLLFLELLLELKNAPPSLTSCLTGELGEESEGLLGNSSSQGPRLGRKLPAQSEEGRFITAAEEDELRPARQGREGETLPMEPRILSCQT